MKTLPHMISKKQEPLAIFHINGSYILAVYQGSISEFDLLLKYRQKDSSTKSGWSRIRTPKHIHWAVDILLKMNTEKEKTKEFINFLIKYWDEKVKPIRSIKERDMLLNDKLIKEISLEVDNYKGLANKGEYSVKFLLLVAKLLMYQEKTNLDTAYMFKNLLETLKEGKDIFKIISVATHR